MPQNEIFLKNSITTEKTSPFLITLQNRVLETTIRRPSGSTAGAMQGTISPKRIYLKGDEGRAKRCISARSVRDPLGDGWSEDGDAPRRGPAFISSRRCRSVISGHFFELVLEIMEMEMFPFHPILLTF